jgi:hypothetical protein
LSKNSKLESLPEPASYLPFTSGRYDEKPNFFRLGKQFGNGKRDEQVLQIDKLAEAYRQQKMRAREIDYARYVCDSMAHNDNDAKTIHRVLARIACAEYPEYFEKLKSENGWSLNCLLTGETIGFDPNDGYIGTTTRQNGFPQEYRTGLDALACQFQEDICIVKVEKNSDHLLAAHLCFPNRWAPTEKIGKSFIEIHRPVARFTTANPNASNLVQALLGKSPYVRFAWGLSNDDQLDHHPDVVDEFQFKNGNDALYVRVERQVLIGLPRNNLLLFFIRTYYMDCRELCQESEIAEGLAKTLLSMSPELLSYKGLSESRDRIVAWLRTKR